MTYLAPCEDTTPAIRSMMLSSRCCSPASGAVGDLMRTAWLSSTVSLEIRPLASSVAPVETRSQMAEASFSRGATSTAPRMVTMSARTSRSLRKRRRILG
ncbi:hypothetical protein D3C72_2007010 [compost metagenome]